MRPLPAPSLRLAASTYRLSDQAWTALGRRGTTFTEAAMIRRALNQAALNLAIFTIEFLVGLAELAENHKNRNA